MKSEPSPDKKLISLEKSHLKCAQTSIQLGCRMPPFFQQMHKDFPPFPAFPQKPVLHHIIEALKQSVMLFNVSFQPASILPENQENNDSCSISFIKKQKVSDFQFKNKNQQMPIKLSKQNDDQSDNSSYHPSHFLNLNQNSKKIKHSTKKTEDSKNISKNYGRAILRFVLLNREYTDKVLTHLSLPKEKQAIFYEICKKPVNSISELRSLWLETQNQFAKAFRILSIEYLRKHCLAYIFGSKIDYFMRHFRYRDKMMKSVGDPENFACIKEY